MRQDAASVECSGDLQHGLLDIAAVQRALRDDGLDGWLLYDFHGSNPIARRVTGLNDAAKLTTRRWYYLIPVDGPPRAPRGTCSTFLLVQLSPATRRATRGTASSTPGYGRC